MGDKKSSRFRAATAKIFAGCPKFGLLIRWLLWTNLLMAGSAAGWVVVTLYALALPLDWVLIMLAFFLTLAFYTRDRLDEKERRADQLTMLERTAWVQSHMTMLRGMLLSSFLGAIGLLMMRPAALPPLFVGLGFALSYTIRWFPWRGQRWGWKHMPGMKMPFVAVLWTLTTVVTPAVVYSRFWMYETLLLAGAVSLLIMSQILLNDLRDIEGDFLHETLSLPVIYGESTARRIGYGLLLMAILLAQALKPVLFMTFIALAIYTFWLLRSYRRQDDDRWRPWIEAQGLVAALIFFIL